MVNKEFLVNEIADRLNKPKQDVRNIIDTFLDIIMENMAKLNPVKLVGFGSFIVRRRAARKGRNPRTGEEIQLPETRTPGFSPSKQLKTIVKGG